ncbi:MAG: hypothetical protein L0Z73_17695 [Gammaproteobacteria bacterium]|nr:hypothetical protein [Gammaproteobacteria bacterium]
MGAFEFAMDTLSSISSAFSQPKGTAKNTFNLNDLSISLDDNATRAFSEFITGMRMLHKHSIHHGCSIAAITRQNLKLLQTNLNATKAYRNTIRRIRSNAVRSNHWAWLPLVNNEDINAGLLYLPTGHIVAPRTAGANVTIHQKELHIPFPADGKSNTGYQLYLGLMGKTCIEFSHPVTVDSEARSTVSTFNNDIESTPICIKRGGTFVEEPALRTVSRLYSTQEPCLLLNIHLLNTPESTTRSGQVQRR